MCEFFGDKYMDMYELTKLVNSGFRPTVEFTCFDKGMKAKLIKITFEEDDCWNCYFDQTDFEKYNEAFMKPNYYSVDGRPIYTAKEAGVWKLEESFYVPNEYKNFFKIIEDNEIFNMFIQDDGCKKNYIEWLEEKVKSCINR